MKMKNLRRSFQRSNLTIVLLPIQARSGRRASAAERDVRPPQPDRQTAVPPAADAAPPASRRIGSGSRSEAPGVAPACKSSQFCIASSPAEHSCAFALRTHRHTLLRFRTACLPSGNGQGSQRKGWRWQGWW